MAIKKFKSSAAFDGEIEATKLKAATVGGDEGGEIFLGPALTNTTLAGGVTIDIWQNRLRFFEQGGDARGYYIDISTGSAGVGSNLVGSGGGGTASNSFSTISVSGQSNVVADSSTDILTLIAGSNISITTNATNDSITFTATDTNTTYSISAETATGGANLRLTDSSAGIDNVKIAAGTNMTVTRTDANTITLDSTGNYTSVDSITYPDYITFDTTPETVPTATGSLFWDDGDGLAKVILNANVELGLGQEQIALVKNATGSSIAKGKVVYINGAQGQRPTIALSDADTEATSSKTLGITAETIADGAEGFVTTFGILRGVNTNSFTAGQALWLSSTAGEVTATIPAEPAHLVFIGYAVKISSTAGEIFVNPQNGYELAELHGVAIENGGSLADNEVLAYDSASGLWINQTGTEAGLAQLSGAVFTGNIELDATKKLIFDGTTDEAYKTTLFIVDPTNDREILLPDASGTLALTGDITTIVGDYIPLTQKGDAQGVAELDIDGLVPVAQLPDLSGTYLTVTTASSTYATQSSLSSYLTTSTAASTYQPIGSYLTIETDPVFVASAAYGITSQNKTDWSSAYGWGDHASAGYLTSATASSTYLTQSNASTTYQPLDQDLTDIAALSANGFLKKTGGVWGMDNSTYLTSYTETSTLSNVTSRGATTSTAISITNTTASSSTSTGALIVSGGVGIGEDLYVNNNVYIGGNLDVTGTLTGSLTLVDVTNLAVTDPLIYLAEGNPSDAVDIGIFAALNHGGGGYTHTGLIRDASDSGKWKLVSGISDPTANVIDFTSATYNTLKIGALEVTDASTTRTNLGLTIGTNVQAYNSTLAAVAGGTYSGDDSITTVGTITTGTWSSTVTGATINNTPIGATTASTGKFTSVDIDGGVLIKSASGTTNASISYLTTSYNAAEFIIFATTSAGSYTSKVLMLAAGGLTPTITEYAILTQGTPPTVTITPGVSGTTPNYTASLSVSVSGGTSTRIIATQVAV